VGANKIAVGHTLNDQAETALFRFIRGSGIEGLSAIHPVMGGIVIRPLLECSRDSILDYLRRTGTQYREDSTNSDCQHSRNRIRRELLPYLRNFNRGLSQRLPGRLCSRAKRGLSSNRRHKSYSKIFTPGRAVASR
jgi:tRNA(Ile)-lysidine synthase